MGHQKIIMLPAIHHRKIMRFTKTPCLPGTMEKDSPSYDLRKEVFGACAGAALYRRSLFDRIGLFDEDFFDTKKLVHLPLKYRG